MNTENTIYYHIYKNPQMLAELLVTREIQTLSNVMGFIPPVYWYSLLLPTETFTNRIDAVNATLNILEQKVDQDFFETFINKMRKYNEVPEGYKTDCCIETNELEMEKNKRCNFVYFLHNTIGYNNLKKLPKELKLDDEQMAAMDALTRRANEKETDYIMRIKQNEMAKQIKMSELKFNIEMCAKDLPDHLQFLLCNAKMYGELTDGK